MSVVLSTTAVQVMRQHRFAVDGDGPVTSGGDFHLLVWAPVRGLLAGYNPYAQPPDQGYLAYTGVSMSTTPHAPSLLILEGLLAVPSLPNAHLLSVGVSCALLWAAMLILSRPETPSALLGTLVLGSAMILSGPSDFLLGLGHVTAWVALGMALVVRCRSALWASLGVSLCLIVPQVGVPLSLFLLVMGYRRIVAFGWAVTAVLSAPGFVLASINGDGPWALLSSWASSVTGLAGEVSTVNRLDLGGRVWALGGVGTTTGLILLISTTVFLSVVKPRLDEISLPGMISVIALAVYTMPYHVTLQLVALVAVATSTQAPSLVRTPSVLVLGAAALSSFSLFWTQRFPDGTLLAVVQPSLLGIVVLTPAYMIAACAAVILQRNRENASTAVVVADADTRGQLNG